MTTETTKRLSLPLSLVKIHRCRLSFGCRSTTVSINRSCKNQRRKSCWCTRHIIHHDQYHKSPPRYLYASLQKPHWTQGLCTTQVFLCTLAWRTPCGSRPSSWWWFGLSITSSRRRNLTPHIDLWPCQKTLTSSSRDCQQFESRHNEHTGNTNHDWQRWTQNRSSWGSDWGSVMVPLDDGCGCRVYKKMILLVILFP